MGKSKDASLILELYDLRREAVMREARGWFFSFNPQSSQDFVEVLLSDNSGFYRMVVSYWDMACSLVNNGAIDEQMFNDANGEHVLVYSKVAPYLAELRTIFGTQQYLAQLEQLVTRIPDIETRLASLGERMAQFRALREQRAAKAATAEV